MIREGGLTLDFAYSREPSLSALQSAEQDDVPPLALLLYLLNDLLGLALGGYRRQVGIVRLRTLAVQRRRGALEEVFGREEEGGVFLRVGGWGVRRERSGAREYALWIERLGLAEGERWGRWARVDEVRYL